MEQTDCQESCQTPWDGPTPTLLTTTHKNHPPTTTTPLPKTHTKQHATHHLTQQATPPTRPWQPTTHTWNPHPGTPGPKNRPCLHTQLGPHLHAIIDTPQYTGTTGHHCPDCHTNWKDHTTATAHKPTWRHPCTPPGRLRNTLTGQPLMVQGPAGIWHYNHDSVWPEGTPPRQLLDRDDLHYRRPLVTWRYGISCYGRLVAQAADYGVQLGREADTCSGCPGRGPAGVCPKRGLYRV